MPHYLCGDPCPRAEDEDKTCEAHSVIFRRLCRHSSSTRDFVFNMNIVCKDCLGKNTLASINDGRQTRDKAKADNERFSQLLKQNNIDELAGREVLDSAVEKRYIDAWRDNLDFLKSWPTSEQGIIDDFERLYGKWNEAYWTNKKTDDSNLPKGVQAVPYFTSDGDQDFFFAQRPHLTKDSWTFEDRMMLKRVTGLKNP